MGLAGPRAKESAGMIIVWSWKLVLVASAFAASPPVHKDEDVGLVWPNAESRANSDPWLARHHDVIFSGKNDELTPDFFDTGFLFSGKNDELTPDFFGVLSNRARHDLSTSSRRTTGRPGMRRKLRSFVRKSEQLQEWPVAA